MMAQSPDELPTYRLIYYRGRGRAEVLRYMLVLAGQPFEDCRITIPQWTAIKKQENMPPDAKLPLLEAEGKVIVGAADIGKFLADAVGINGQSDGEREQVAGILSIVEGLYPNLAPVVRGALGKNDRQKKDAWEQYKENSLNQTLQKLSELLGNRHFFVGNYISWADLAVCEILTRFEQCFDGMCLRDYANLKEHAARIERLPNLRNWIEKRPRTVF